MLAQGVMAMGTLRIGQEVIPDLDDTLLEHVFVVVISKLRRQEPVLLSWRNPSGYAEQALVNASMLVHARYTSLERVPLEREWLERLMVAANSNRGLSLTSASGLREPRIALPLRAAAAIAPVAVPPQPARELTVPA